MVLLIDTVVAVWLLWVAFVAIMHLRRVKNKWGLTKAQKALGYPLLVIGYVLDLGLRCTLFMFMDPKVRFDWYWKIPVPETVSAMLERHALHGDDWRKPLAHWFREELLADFDPTGSHGKPGRD